MAVRINTALRNRQANSIGTAFDGGATLHVYSGAQPASANSVASGTLLCSISAPADAFDAAVAGVVAKLGAWTGVGLAADTIGWARLVSADLSLVIDLDEGTDFTVNTPTVSVGSTVTVTTLSLTHQSGE